jgi:hypothetical protein
VNCQSILRAAGAMFDDVVEVQVLLARPGDFDGLNEASNSGPITFDAIRLELSRPGWWQSTSFDSSARQLALRNVSLRDLILLAYPASSVNSDPELIDQVSYDIEARWHDAGTASERHVYRQLLESILRTNSNLQIYVGDRCERGCEADAAR